MSDTVISVENLSKRYRLRHRKSGASDGLRHILNSWATAPFRALRSVVRSAPSFTPDIRLLPAESRCSGQEDFWALKDVSFEVRQGEVVGIIGRNGAGKSTLLKILSQITEPTEGRVRIKGRVASLLEVGTGFHPELTGRENIFLNGAILGMSKSEIKAKFDEIVAFSEVDKFLDTPVKRYSSGMYVRLAFAVAAHLEPEILVVDEVLAVGDAQFQKKCLGKMREVNKGGRTVLLVSHNMGTIQKLCGRGLLMSKGGIARDGSIEESISQYFKENRDFDRRWTASGLSLKVSFLDSSRKAITNWGYGEELIISVSIESETPILRPAIDLAFYNEAGVKVFAVQTDKISGNAMLRSPASSLVLEIGVCNVGLAVPSLSVDIGVRGGEKQGYIAWWERVETLPIGTRNLESYHVSDAILAPPVRIKNTSFA